MRNRIKYSQNFIKDINLVKKLVNLGEIRRSDMVIEIGSGNGIITSVLANTADKVFAYELDNILYTNLKNKFKTNHKVTINKVNFLETELPDFPYKVFSNPPFNITADIIKKLLFAENPPADSYLILQKEAAAKFIGKPFDRKNSLQAVLIYPWFESKIIYNFSLDDFYPKPKVKVVLANFKKRAAPLIKNLEKENYYDFVSYIFNQYKPKLPGNATQSEVEFEEWIRLFDSYSGQNKGAYRKLMGAQENLEKIHRTRLDKSWRIYKNS